MELEQGRCAPPAVDASSCTFGLASEILPYLGYEQRARQERLTLFDSVTWAARHLAPRMPVVRKVDSVAVYATCSTQHLGVTGDLINLAASLADDVLVPDTMTCCAFAGDRGLLHPEPTASATAREAEQVRSASSSVHVSANRTCEVGMGQATESVYESVIFLLEEATPP
ncbi:hypothetical protein HEP87_52535 [Streptomyces sp. S1D4-11]|nr:hypothetical protein [Streptomyces sp. S1D4-11]QIZ00782.1 hypothetical protein HEP87_52535 [Streptomyces sp. S1D4-11]